MTYIPVGTILTYSCTYQFNLITRQPQPQDVITRLKQDLLSLQGAEELDIQNSSASATFFGTTQNFSINVLNNGVDHGSETDIQSIIDGTLENEGIQLIASNISKIKLPNNPDDGTPQVIDTGATPTTAPPVTATPSKPFSLGGLFGTTGTLTAGFVILIVLIVALILIFPGGFRKAISG